MQGNYVHLTNKGNKSHDLTSWTLVSTAGGQSRTYKLQQATIQAGKSINVCCSTTRKKSKKKLFLIELRTFSNLKNFFAIIFLALKMTKKRINFQIWSPNRGGTHNPPDSYV